MRHFINAMLAFALVAFLGGMVSARHLAELHAMQAKIAAVQPASLRPSISR